MCDEPKLLLSKAKRSNPTWDPMPWDLSPPVEIPAKDINVRADENVHVKCINVRADVNVNVKYIWHS